MPGRLRSSGLVVLAILVATLGACAAADALDLTQPDGRQHVAVLAGVGGGAAAAALGLTPEIDPTIARGFANAMTDLPDVTPQGGTLYVFALRQGDARATTAAAHTSRPGAGVLP